MLHCVDVTVGVALWSVFCSHLWCIDHLECGYAQGRDYGYLCLYVNGLGSRYS